MKLVEVWLYLSTVAHGIQERIGAGSQHPKSNPVEGVELSQI